MSSLKAEKFLIIVESPNKVKTINNILQKAGYTGAKTVASVGHIITLKNGGPAFNSGIYPKQNFKLNLAVSDEKKKIANDISKLAKTVDKIFIMTDGDREGEIISWSLIKFCDLPPEKCFRAITHEITPKAVISALESPVTFNNNLVNAGLSRMMIDKLIGYGLSPLGKKYLGAKSIGRCQSVGLKLISEREHDINNFIPEIYFNLYLYFFKNNMSFKAKYCGYQSETITKFTNQADVDAIINDCKNSSFSIESIKTLMHQEAPKPPFCTATFQQEAANKLGLKVKDAMSCAQKLFEGININGEHKGLITYMRTDSTEISKEFIPTLQKFIEDNYGAKMYTAIRKAKTKNTDQSGHEALRVVDLDITPELLEKYINNDLLIKVYSLIWQRTIAAALPNALFKETLHIINNKGHKFEFNYRELLNPGYKVIYKFDDSFENSTNTNFSIGEVLEKTELESIKKLTQPKPRYTEASLVKELQQREIGRPSTYASIVETLLSPTRGYAKLKEKYIVPTDRGMQLADYCNRSFPNIININYTKQMEESLDKIANGEISWLDFMDNFYKNLKQTINETNETGIAPEMPEKLCPNCNSIMVVRRSRFGRLFYGCSAYPKCNGIIGID